MQHAAFSILITMQVAGNLEYEYAIYPPDDRVFTAISVKKMIPTVHARPTIKRL